MQKIHFNSPEDVHSYMSHALALTEQLDPPHGLRVAFFTAAVNLFATSTLLQPQATPVQLPALAIPRKGH
jgi:hypothetical protein